MDSQRTKDTDPLPRPQSQDTERKIWPMIIGYAETVRLLAAWCELRQGFAISAQTASSPPNFLTRAIGVPTQRTPSTLATLHGVRARIRLP